MPPVIRWHFVVRGLYPIAFLKKLFCIDGKSPARRTKLFITVKQNADAMMRIIPLYLSGIADNFNLLIISLLYNTIKRYRYLRQFYSTARREKLGTVKAIGKPYRIYRLLYFIVCEPFSADYKM